MFSACASHGEETLPEFVIDLIADSENGRMVGRVTQIWRVRFKGKSFYYVVPECCDQVTTLYDQHGTFLCAPSGGLSGMGDGKCSGMSPIPGKPVLVWDDKRAGASQ